MRKKKKEKVSKVEMEQRRLEKLVKEMKGKNVGFKLQKTEQINFKLDSLTKRSIERAAKAEGLPVTHYILVLHEREQERKHKRAQRAVNKKSKKGK